MLKLSFYVPEAALEVVKLALFNAGAGRIGLYDHCAWQVLGQGQFRPLLGANPAIGQTPSEHQSPVLERVDEYLVEMVLEDEYLVPVVQALKQAHPYEEPAFGVFAMLDLTPFGL
ncbi:MAG: NGG1p interacting factor NIF3 [Marinagarivorans sp.]|nr:NGG1p interacting factor NIF3 [Marinagarivorans sp.]